MKKMFVSIVVLCGLIPFSGYAFPLSFKYAMCTMEAPALQDGVEELISKWQQVKRVNAPRGQYYKHVKGHIKEAVAAIDETVERSDCSAERKILLGRLRDDLIASL